MPKFYRVDEDDFQALSFQSDMDEGLEGHALIIEEQFKEEFIAEQVGRFTLHLLSILNEMPTRGKYNPFNRISKKYPREHYKDFGDPVICPVCHTELDEEDWDMNMYEMRPCCLMCDYEFEMEEEE